MGRSILVEVLMRPLGCQVTRLRSRWLSVRFRARDMLAKFALGIPLAVAQAGHRNIGGEWEHVDNKGQPPQRQ